jgi:hypothetical protein
MGLMPIGKTASKITNGLSRPRPHGAAYHANLAVCNRFPRSPALGSRTFFSGGAVAIFNCHLTAASIRAFLSSIWPPIPGILMGTPSR